MPRLLLDLLVAQARLAAAYRRATGQPATRLLRGLTATHIAGLTSMTEAFDG